MTATILDYKNQPIFPVETRTRAPMPQTRGRPKNAFGDQEPLL